MTTVGMIVVTLTMGATRTSGTAWVEAAHWHMNEKPGTTMTDSVAGYRGTITDMRTGAPGYAGLAYAFNGTSSYASVPSVDALNPGSRDIRLTVYIKTSHKPDKPDWDLFRKGYAYRSPGRYKIEYQPTGRASCDFADTANSHGAGRVTGGPDLADGQWHRVSCTKTATSIGLTVDAQTVATKKVTLGTISNSTRSCSARTAGPVPVLPDTFGECWMRLLSRCGKQRCRSAHGLWVSDLGRCSATRSPSSLQAGEVT